MNDDHMQDKLADYLGDELSPPDRAAFEAHVNECRTCREEVESLRCALTAMKSLDAAPVAAPAVLYPARRASFLTPFTYAAVLLFGIGLGWMIRPVERNSTNVTAPAESREVHLVSARGVDESLFRAIDKRNAKPFARNLAAFAHGLNTTAAH